MKYLKTFAPLLALFTIVVFVIAITSPDAGTAGERSAGLVMMMCGAVAVWIILELVALGKKEEPSPEPQEPGK